MTNLDLPEWWTAPQPKDTLYKEAEAFSDENLFPPQVVDEPGDFYEHEEEAVFPDYATATPEIRELMGAVVEVIDFLNEGADWQDPPT